MKPLCQYPGCNNVATNTGKGELSRWCQRHRKKSNRPEEVGRPCAQQGCTALVFGLGCYCDVHRENRPRNREKVNEAASQWRAKNRDRYNELNRNYYHRNKDAIRVRENARRIANKDAIKAREKAKRQAERSQPCWLCGWKEATCDKHRIIPGKVGGRYTRSNTVIICPSCHRLAHERPKRFSRKLCRAILSGMPIQDYFLRIANSLVALWELTNAPALQSTFPPLSSPTTEFP